MAYFVVKRPIGIKYIILTLHEWSLTLWSIGRERDLQKKMSERYKTLKARRMMLLLNALTWKGPLTHLTKMLRHLHCLKVRFIFMEGPAVNSSLIWNETSLTDTTWGRSVRTHRRSGFCWCLPLRQARNRYWLFSRPSYVTGKTGGYWVNLISF